MARGTKVRHVRVPDDLWDAAKAATAAEGTDITKVLVAALTEYVTRHAPKAE